MSARPERSASKPLGGLAAKILAVHELLDSLEVEHQFGGAIALAWYRSPRATADIDLNVSLQPSMASRLLDVLESLGVSVTTADRAAVERDGQVRLDWDGSYLDLFFATVAFHDAIARRARLVDFGSASIPVMAPEHLVACKAIFDRPKDWVDIDAMLEWGTEIDSAEALRWVEEILGTGSDIALRLRARLGDRLAAGSSGGAAGSD